jgi:hypothetical protein
MADPLFEAESLLENPLFGDDPLFSDKKKIEEVPLIEESKAEPVEVEKTEKVAEEDSMEDIDVSKNYQAIPDQNENKEVESSEEVKEEEKKEAVPVSISINKHEIITEGKASFLSKAQQHCIYYIHLTIGEKEVRFFHFSLSHTYDIVYDLKLTNKHLYSLKRRFVLVTLKKPMRL